MNGIIAARKGSQLIMSSRNIFSNFICALNKSIINDFERYFLTVRNCNTFGQFQICTTDNSNMAYMTKIIVIYNTVPHRIGSD